MRNNTTFQISDNHSFRNQLLNYSSKFEHFVFLDSCGNNVYGETEFDYLLAAGNYKSVIKNAGGAFDELQQFLDKNKEWCFGFLGYDLKNEIEKLSSQNHDSIGFPDMMFFIPEIIVKVKNGKVILSNLSESSITLTNEEIFQEICNRTESVEREFPPIKLIPKINKEDYLKKINEIRQHIIDGDVYELTFCQEFYSENVAIEPLIVFEELCKISKAPFSVLFRWENKYLISASPERFLKRSGNKIISQPIKGTKRKGNTVQDNEQLKQQLQTDTKERAENVMIVDLTRNDLARSSKPGTVQVEELFGVYEFNTVHQMISTVLAE